MGGHLSCFHILANDLFFFFDTWFEQNAEILSKNIGQESSAFPQKPNKLGQGDRHI